MSTHTSNSDPIQGSLGNVSQMRVRSISENLEPFPGVGGSLAPGGRRRYNRSYTEGQPDVSFPFEDIGAYLRGAVPEEETESTVARSKEALNTPAVPVQHNVPSVKVSSQSIDDSEVFERDFPPVTLNTGTHPMAKQMSVRQESAESKETMTPVESSDAQTLVGDDVVVGEEDNLDQGYLLDGELKVDSDRREIINMILFQ